MALSSVGRWCFLLCHMQPHAAVTHSVGWVLLTATTTQTAVLPISATRCTKMSRPAPRKFCCLHAHFLARYSPNWLLHLALALHHSKSVYCYVHTGTHLTGSCHNDTDDMYMIVASHVPHVSTPSGPGALIHKVGSISIIMPPNVCADTNPACFLATTQPTHLDAG